MLSFCRRFTAIFVAALLLAPLSSFAASPRQSAPPEVVHRSDARSPSATSSIVEAKLRVQWRRLFNENAWAKLDSLANHLRTRRLRFQGGGWQLHVLYTILSTTSSETNEAWEARIAALQEWIRQSPSSPTPRIALADVYLNFAWKARGNGLPDSVTSEGWNMFEARIRKARELLEQSERIGRVDPEWYDAMLVVASAQGWKRPQVDALANEAITREPGYFYDVRVVADYLLPKWYGAPGDTEQFVNDVADHIGGERGDATYFFIAEYILTVEQCDCPSSNARSMSWLRIRKGYAAVQRLYGTNNFEHNALAFLALRAADDKTAARAFEQIGNNWDRDVWGSKAFFDDCRRNTLKHFRAVRPESKPIITAY